MDNEMNQGNMNQTDVNQGDMEQPVYYHTIQEYYQAAAGAPENYTGTIAYERKPWTSTILERIVAVLILPVTFMYVQWIFEFEEYENVYFGIFVVLFLALSEAFYWKRKRTPESFAFLIMTIFSAVGAIFDFGNLWGMGAVWEQGMCVFFTHLFAVYWILVRSDRLAEGETSHMFLWDGITGFFVMTFKNFPLDVRTIISIFKSKKGQKNKKIWIVFPAIIVGIILLCIAVSYLKSADENYAYMIDSFLELIKIEWDFTLVWKLFLTALFGSYLYGLLGGCYRETKEQVQHRGDNIKKVIGSLKKVPHVVWVIFIGLFSAFYVVYFVLQGSYLFDAIRMILPEEYTFSQNAHKGFESMCAVMVVNFVLLWIATRTSDKMTKPVKVASVVLLFESILFAVIAFLKLFMYIDAYGFTPLRLQSVWLVLVLLFACACWLINILAEVKTAKVWFIGSAATLAILCLI